jgi:hypothetical protein
MNRRAFLKVGTLSVLGLSLSDYLRLAEAQGVKTARAKSVILIYTMGGISHHDSFDPKPNAAAEIRGEFKTISTKLPGVHFTEQIPLLAQTADTFALIRSVVHTQTDHGVAAYFLLRGYPQGNPREDRPENQHSTYPTIGSHVARLFGWRDGMPPYVCVPGLSYLAQINYYTAGWMGRAYDPFVLRSDPSQSTYEVRDLAPPSGISSARANRRASLAQAMDYVTRLFEASPDAKSMTTYYEKAYNILSAGTARRAFDLSAETSKVRDAYGRTRLGQSCLLARRLVEADVPFVTVDDDGWDHHSSIFPGLKQRLPELDRCLTTLLTDLRERGLLETTLVTLLTDFGRTPKINSSAGRDHWPNVFSVLFAGAGIPGGQVIGASDAIGAEPTERAITPKDIAATLYHFLGIDPFQEYMTPEGRPLKVLDEGEVIRELS